jgi:hypothetical protein
MPGKFQEMLLKYLANTTEIKQQDLEVQVSKIKSQLVYLLVASHGILSK